MPRPETSSSPNRASFDNNLRRRIPVTKAMGDLHNISIFGDNIQSWHSTSNQDKCYLQSKHEELYLGQTQGDGTAKCSNLRNNIAQTVGVQYPNLMVAAGTNKQVHSLNLRHDNANTNFYARVLGAMPPSSSSSSCALQRPEKDYNSEAPFNRGFSKSLLQLGLHNPQENNSPASANMCFMQSKLESSQHKYSPSPYLARHNSAKSLFGTTVISASTPPNEASASAFASASASAFAHHSRSLSLPDVLHFVGGGKEQESHKVFPMAGPLETPANFLVQERFESDSIPSVTVVVEGRSICQRISLQQHCGYASFARAIRRLFAESISTVDTREAYNDKDCNLSNAVPGYLIAYEDNEGDLLLVGDLSWKDFVRAAKRIRLLPAKKSQGRVRKREL